MADATERKDQSPGRFWANEIEEASGSCENWVKRGRKVVSRYRDERDASSSRKRKFNILWANVQVLMPAHYGRQPKPEVARRYKDQDEVGRTAALILERCLEYEVEQYSDFDAALRGAVEDKLLPGRGTAWVRFEPNTSDEPLISEDIDATVPKAEYECAPCDYVSWEDFLHNPARTWEEVWWVGRRVWMTRDEGLERFGDVFKGVPIGDKDRELADEVPEDAFKKKAAVWEVWDKSEKTVIWIADGYDQLLDEKPDPLQLDGFFPCPKPLYATTTTGSLIPIPDYVEYQDQAEELDVITERIAMLVKALKVTGVYNAEFSGVQRVLNEGIDNQMIPVDSWAAFAEKGGLKGAMEFVPIEDVLRVLNGLYEAREVAKQGIYEIMGVSDIIRGATDPAETLGAQQMKASYGSLRLRESQQEVAVFATDLLRKKAEIISQFFSDQTIVAMSGVQYTMDANLIGPALQLIRSNVRDFRIAIEADTLAQLDEQAEKRDRVEFLTAVGAFLDKSLPAIQAYPPVAKLLGELLLFGVRGFKIGNTVEAAFEQAMSQLGAQQQTMSPEMMERQAQMQQQAQELQAMSEDLQRKSDDLAKKELALAEKDMALDGGQLRAEVTQAKKEFDIAKKALEVRVKEIQAEARAQALDNQQAGVSREAEIAQAVAQALEVANARHAEATSAQTETMTSLIAALVQAMAAPKRTKLVRGKDGRASHSETMVIMPKESKLTEGKNGSELMEILTKLLSAPQKTKLKRGPDGRAESSETLMGE